MSELSRKWVLLRIQNYLRAQFSEASQAEILHGLKSDKRHVGMALHAQKRDKHNLRSFLLLLWFKIYLKVFEFGLKSIPVFSVLLLLSCGSERRIHRKLIRDKKKGNGAFQNRETSFQLDMPSSLKNIFKVTKQNICFWPWIKGVSWWYEEVIMI